MMIKNPNNLKKQIRIFSALYLALILSVSAAKGVTPQRIITLSSAISETVYALGYGSKIVATDVTSTAPAFISALPKVNRNRNISAEVILAFKADLVLAFEKDIPKELRYQLNHAGIKLVTLNQSYSTSGACEFIKNVAIAIGEKEKGLQIAAQTKEKLDKAISKIKSEKVKAKKILFIYARGAGNMIVAGRGSQMAEIITLAGGINAVKEFTDYKPYSTEVLIATNPEVLLFFDFGSASLGGSKAILDLPGIKNTGSGIQRKLIEVDGPLMVNFSSRLPEAILNLHDKIYP